MIRPLAALTALALLAGCASLSEDQCRAGNWGAIGERDGQAGRSASYFSRHVEACAEFGIRPDRAQWEAGRQRGLVLYCTPRNAYEIGREGDRLNDVCPAPQAAVLAAANRRGRTYYSITQEMEAVDDRIDDVRRRIAALPPEAETELAALRSELSRLRFDLSRLRLQRMRYDSL